MPLVLTQQVETRLPIDVKGITPCRLREKSKSEIAKLTIWHGRKQAELGEYFEIAGELDQTNTIQWQGNLQPVHWIGAEMQSGKMLIQSDTGRHVGSQMTGGEIMVNGNVSDYLGVEMTGGLIRVAGNAGDLVGANYPGSKTGMNRGSILIDGNAGKGVGQAMRRGTIAVGGSTNELTGWNMLAGTILIFGKPGANVAAGITRGTIVLAGGLDQGLLPTFRPGGTYQMPILSMLANWLTSMKFQFDANVLKSRFQEFNGDLLRGGRGEILVAR